MLASLLGVIMKYTVEMIRDGMIYSYMSSLMKIVLFG
jgi:hypothetical protein